MHPKGLHRLDTGEYLAVWHDKHGQKQRTFTHEEMRQRTLQMGMRLDGKKVYRFTSSKHAGRQGQVMWQEAELNLDDADFCNGFIRSLIKEIEDNRWVNIAEAELRRIHEMTGIAMERVKDMMQAGRRVLCI